MPTGFTARIDETTTFAQFALLCARNFGATITMRDDSFDAIIPEVFEPSDYHTRALSVARSRLTEVNAMTVADAEVEAARNYDRERSAHAKSAAERKANRAKYDRMLAKVEDWTPPTPDHRGMKSFMLDQLRETIRFDCSDAYYTPPTLFSGEEWIASERASAERDVKYHADEHAAEVARCETRTKWVRDLRDSLAKLPR